MTLKRLKAQQPFSGCAPLALGRKVFEAFRLNLGWRLNPTVVSWQEESASSPVESCARVCKIRKLENGNSKIGNGEGLDGGARKA
ncbi:MAG: hypothetical protein DMG40_10635 [Acidobacteria bacterium]|nr:MAG: hypothetical protein DMG40_10635 [Acidobacteriota bacterium]